MSVEEFNANERIAGFSLVAIKQSLVLVGLFEERNDLEDVAGSLRCPLGQAARVLQELERRGFVTKTKRKYHWELTDKGRRLGSWRPPPKHQAAIDWEEKGLCNDGIVDVPCWFLRATPDREAVFEDARLELEMCVEFDTDRLVAIHATRPDNPDDPDSASRSELTVHLSAAEARTVAAGLLKAAELADGEQSRRVAVTRIREQTRERVAALQAPAGSGVKKRASTAARSTTKPRPARQVEPTSTRPSDEPAKPERVNTSWVAELREQNRSRSKTGLSGRPSGKK